MEWLIAVALGGFALLVRQLYVIAEEQRATRAEVEALRKQIDSGFGKTIRQLTDVIEIHLDVPDEDSIFRGKER